MIVLEPSGFDQQSTEVISGLEIRSLLVPTLGDIS
jgi:hypothetical protein